MNKPPCADWKIWVGKEIEGSADLGETTLFVRVVAGYTPQGLRMIAPECNRIWFCKEFHNWNFIKECLPLYSKVCIECPSHLPLPPKEIRERARIYFKIDLDLKEGDFVCVGPAFKDEAFEIGKGVKVTPEMYADDKRLL